MDISPFADDNLRMRVRWILPSVLALLSVCFAQSTSSSSDSGSNAAGLNPIRTSQTHSQSAGRSTDIQSLERLGMDGRYVPYLDVEKESVQVNATTTRTLERTYGRDADGRKTLTQVVEEVKTTSPAGTEKVIRNTSSADADARLQLVRREVQDTNKISANIEDSKTTAYTVGSDGQMLPSVQTEERRTRSDDKTVQFRKSTLLPDVNGKWQVQEVRDGVIQDDGRQLTKEERVSSPNNDGQLAVTEKTVTKEAKSQSGESQQTVESYSTSIPGSADVDRLRLNQRVSTAQHKTLQGGMLTEQQVWQRNAGTPNDGPRLTQKTIDIVRPTTSGGSEHQQQTISIDTNGRSNLVWVDIGKSSVPPKQDSQKNQPAVTTSDKASVKPQ
jgi:hypothetical protein